MNKPIHWVTDRAKEPSTWAGIATIATAIAQFIEGNHTAALQLVFGLLAVAMKEKGPQS